MEKNYYWASKGKKVCRGQGAYTRRDGSSLNILIED
jgi:hypothetical protein